MFRIASKSALAVLLLTTAGCGLMPPKEAKIRYSAEEELMPLRTLERGGDFALFYVGHEKAEVPVRVNAGDSIGFYRVEDGRLKAIAGPFKMDMDPNVHEAYWRRMNYLDE